ncbi:homoserine O-succinyltransferase [Enterobacteriaceae endosymbiont of Neohaemonia nigricornis]|uniref:homoserine O-succinyltransferase n=1 Tax=Enterobacteriaceae endosymbiont of Neohaemonia nigricornis TaxID=2675792 RepID=UPI0014497135|nr:homoserine O-succinyltransferase [Enterobacteriaceae endosymbiont of Neohaemonia nigricornis]QJC30413.1 homoserine O-succinyltransferase [Enterobacteriaceae endosymbiont of Neohaemonia nigricornis]
MPVIVPDKLPAIDILKQEHIVVLSNKNIPKYNNSYKIINILLLNLMYKKIDTENQIIRLLSYSPLYIKLTLLYIHDIQSHNINSLKHTKKFYYTLEQIMHKKYDGLIITGAPLGLIPFSKIRYWNDFVRIIYWSKEHVHSILSFCWSVQAILYILYNIPKCIRNTKLLGIFKHKIVLKNNLLVQGFDDYFFAPHSRYADFSLDIIKNYTDLNIISYSKEAGVYLCTTYNKKYIFITGHPEYDFNTIAKEYFNDLKKNNKIHIPYNYFTKNNIFSKPINTWKSHGYLLFSNWIHNFIYINK